MSDPESPFGRVGIKPFCFHAFDADVRVAVYFGDNGVDLLLGSLHFHGHRTVIFVFDPAGHTVSLGGMLRLKAETDRLHPAVKTDALAQKRFIVIHVISRPEPNNKTDR